MQAVQAIPTVPFSGTEPWFTPEVHLSAEDLVEMGVKDSYNFGPPLIENGKKVTIQYGKFCKRLVTDVL